MRSIAKRTPSKQISHSVQEGVLLLKDSNSFVGGINSILSALQAAVQRNKKVKMQVSHKWAGRKTFTLDIHCENSLPLVHVSASHRSPAKITATFGGKTVPISGLADMIMKHGRFPAEPMP